MSDQPEQQPEEQAANQPESQPPAPSTPPAPKGGYSKRPVWQWVLLYAIVAAIVYYGVYLIFFHHTGSTGGVSY